MKIEKISNSKAFKPLVNKVAKSAIETIDLEQFYPKEHLYEFDLKDYLFRGMILREKDFREAVNDHEWAKYQDGILLVFNSADAIIPMWAYMLIGNAAADYVKSTYHGPKADYLADYYRHFITNMDLNPYKEGRIILKGCGKKPIPPTAYMELTRLLKPHVKSIMFGEACSTVPIFKRK